MTYLTADEIVRDALTRALPRIEEPHPLEDLGTKVMAELLAEFSADGTRLSQATKLVLWTLALRDVDRPDAEGDVVNAVGHLILSHTTAEELPEYAADRLRSLF